MLKNKAPRTGFAIKNELETEIPSAEVLVFEQVLKQRLRRDLPRGFILVFGGKSTTPC